MDNDQIAGVFLFVVGIVMVSLICWGIITDEYNVDIVKECTVYKIEYRCHITNGETLFRCETKEECNKLCNNKRIGK